MSNQDITNPADGIRQEEKYTIPSLPLPYDDQLSQLDPLIKMAIIYHQFESIHPFYDGNGWAFFRKKKWAKRTIISTPDS